MVNFCKYWNNFACACIKLSIGMCICVCLCKVCVLYCQQGRPLNGESQVKSRRRPVLVLALQQPIKTMLRAKLVSLFVCICNWVAILLKLSVEVYSVHCTHYFGIHEKNVTKVRSQKKKRYYLGIFPKRRPPPPPPPFGNPLSKSDNFEYPWMMVKCRNW